MFRGTLRGSNLRLEEESLNLRLEEELRSFVEPGPGGSFRGGIPMGYWDWGFKWDWGSTRPPPEGLGGIYSPGRGTMLQGGSSSRT